MEPICRMLIQTSGSTKTIMDKIGEILNEWQASVSPKSKVRKFYDSTGTKILLVILVTIDDEKPFLDKVFYCFCDKEEAKVTKAIEDLEERKSKAFDN